MFGKRVAYRPIFHNDVVLFNELQVINLIQQVSLEARTSKKSKIFLWVIEDNLSARKFYENNGFIASGKTCLIEGTTKTDMCYELIL